VTSSDNQADPRGTEGVRLQKALAAAGVASRRVSEQLIVAGRVSVNGEVVTELGSRVDPAVDHIAVDGQAVQLDPQKRYYMLNKPTGVVSSMQDGHGRPDLRRFTDDLEERVFNVGRLDAETSGLLLLTNDGDLAHVLAHPSFGVEKTYVAKVTGRMSPQTLQQLKRGIELDDGMPHRVELVRRSFGPLHLGTLRSGAMRELTTVELGQLLTISRAAEAGRSGSADSQDDSQEGDS